MAALTGFTAAWPRMRQGPVWAVLAGSFLCRLRTCCDRPNDRELRNADFSDVLIGPKRLVD